jgi:hypothetical protein
LERVQDQPSKVETLLKFARDFRASGDFEKGLPADKDFIDSLYEDD